VAELAVEEVAVMDQIFLIPMEKVELQILVVAEAVVVGKLLQALLVALVLLLFDIRIPN
jgi:hypothetical protein